MVRLALARKAYAEAAQEAGVLVKVNPASAYAPQLLLRASQACKSLGKDDLAKAALKQIVEKYPESPLAADAAKALK